MWWDPGVPRDPMSRTKAMQRQYKSDSVEESSKELLSLRVTQTIFESRSDNLNGQLRLLVDLLPILNR